MGINEIRYAGVLNVFNKNIFNVPSQFLNNVSTLFVFNLFRSNLEEFNWINLKGFKVLRIWDTVNLNLETPNFDIQLTKIYSFYGKNSFVKKPINIWHETI